jgi:hypothetical protein
MEKEYRVLIKVMTWQECYITLEGDTELDIDLRVKQLNKDDEWEQYVYDSDSYFEFNDSDIDTMTYKENGNSPTVEVYNNDDNGDFEMIYENIPVEVQRDNLINLILEGKEA